MAHMRAEMLAISINHPHLPVFATPDCKIGGEIAERFDLTDGKIAGEHHRIPAEGKADIQITLCDGGAAFHVSHAPVDQILAFELLENLPHGHWGGAGVGCCFFICG